MCPAYYWVGYLLLYTVEFDYNVEALSDTHLPICLIRLSVLLPALSWLEQKLQMLPTSQLRTPNVRLRILW